MHAGIRKGLQFVRTYLPEAVRLASIAIELFSSVESSVGSKHD